MKKYLAVFMAALLLLAAVPVAASAAEDDLRLIFVTDTHFNGADSSNPVTKSTDDDPFGHYVSNGKMTAESKAILQKFFEEASATDAEYVIFTGDTSDTGKAEDVVPVVAMIEEFERTSGKKVIVAEGNHECEFAGASMTSSEFKNYYRNLGYDLANEVDPDSASYTVDLNSKYRLIVIDTNNFNDSRVNWIDAQVKKANDDGKKLISVTHYSLVYHYTVQNFIHWSAIDKSFNIGDRFIEWGIKFNFSGHTHELDIEKYSNDNGEVYDIASGALTTYPACYRTAVFGKEGVQINTNYIKSIDTSLVPDGLAAEAKDLMTADFRAYAKRLFIEGSKRGILDYVNVNYVISAAKISRADDPEIVAVLEKVIPRLAEALSMPLYGKEGSVESIAKEYGFKLPKSSYTSLIDVVAEVYAAHCAGNEDYSAYTDEGTLLINGLCSALSYSLEPLSDAEVTAVLNWAVNKLGYGDKIPSTVLSLVSSVAGRADGISYLAGYLLTPLIEEFAVDEAPNDVTALLPNYGYEQAKVMTLLERIKQLFRTLASLLKGMFAFIKNKKL